MDIKEVQHLLGHASPNITMNIYLHYCEQQRQKETFDKVRESKNTLLPDERCGTNVVQSKNKNPVPTAALRTKDQTV